MKDKVIPSKPFLMLVYGYPGAGKTTFARQFAQELPMVHLQTDKFQHEVHELSHGQASGLSPALLRYMTTEFLQSDLSVVFDASVTKKSERKLLRNLAKKVSVQTVLVWLQIDQESAFARTQKRDRRKNEDKYANEYSASDFQSVINDSQNPDGEDYVVISGKHTFHTQRGTVMKKLYELGIITQQAAQQKVVKPGLVNIIPQLANQRAPSGQVTRRNISIR